jgi:HEAT repeat protein
MALEALGKLDAAAAVPSIARRLKDVDATVRAAAIEALGRLGAKDRIDGIAVRLDDFDRDVRRAAASWLCVLGSRRGVPLLLDKEYELFFLNALRSPEEWRKLSERRRLPSLRGTASECWRRWLEEARLKLRESMGEKENEVVRLPAALSLLESARTLARMTSCHVVLEKDGLRALSRDQALKYWRDWWEAEQGKK